MKQLLPGQSAESERGTGASSSKPVGDGGSEAPGKNDLLMRFFESEWFDAWIALTYLHKNTSPGVQDYLAHRLYSLPEREVERYLSQLCQICVQRPGCALELTLVDLCARSLRVAVKTYWILVAISQDRSRDAHVAALRDRCEQAALEGSWKLPFKEYRLARLQLGPPSSWGLPAGGSPPAGGQLALPQQAQVPSPLSGADWASPPGRGLLHRGRGPAGQSGPGGVASLAVAVPAASRVQSPDPPMGRRPSGASAGGRREASRPTSPDPWWRPMSPDSLGAGMYSSVFMDAGVEGLIGFGDEGAGAAGSRAERGSSASSKPQRSGGSRRRLGWLRPGGAGGQAGERACAPVEASGRSGLSEEAARVGPHASQAPAPLFSPPNSPRRRQMTFGATLDFIDALCTASSGLTAFPPEDRDWALRRVLQSIDDEVDRAAKRGVAIWFPQGQRDARVVRLEPRESNLLNSREKAPFTLYLEVLEEEGEEEGAGGCATPERAEEEDDGLLAEGPSPRMPSGASLPSEPGHIRVSRARTPFEESLDAVASPVKEEEEAEEAHDGEPGLVVLVPPAASAPPPPPLQAPTCSASPSRSPSWASVQGPGGSPVGPLRGPEAPWASAEETGSGSKRGLARAASLVRPPPEVRGMGEAVASPPGPRSAARLEVPASPLGGWGCAPAFGPSPGLGEGEGEEARQPAAEAGEPSDCPTRAPSEELARPARPAEDALAESNALFRTLSLQAAASAAGAPEVRVLGGAAAQEPLVGAGTWIGRAPSAARRRAEGEGRRSDGEGSSEGEARPGGSLTTSLHFALQSLRGDAPLVRLELRVDEGQPGWDAGRPCWEPRSPPSATPAPSPAPARSPAACASHLLVRSASSGAETASQSGSSSEEPPAFERRASAGLLAGLVSLGSGTVHPADGPPSPPLARAGAAAGKPAAAAAAPPTCGRAGWSCRLGFCRACAALASEAGGSAARGAEPPAPLAAEPARAPRVQVRLTVQGGVDLSFRRTPSKHARVPSHEAILQVARKHRLPAPLLSREACGGGASAAAAPGPRASPPRSTPLKTQLYGEAWEARRERMRLASPHGARAGWDIRCVVVKSGDDCRQELLAMQLIRALHDIFAEAALPLFLRPYEVLVTSSRTALIELVPNAPSVHTIKARSAPGTSLRQHLGAVHGEGTLALRTAQRCFVESLAAYSLVCYLLQIKDRHNGNILLDAQGHVIHIDFGFMLSNSPGGVNFESAPFKLTRELLEVMDSGPDGRASELFDYFKVLMIQGFLAARKHSDRILLLVEMMAQSGAPCFKNRAAAVGCLRKRFHLALPEHKVVEVVLGLISESLDAWRTRQYDYYQRVLNGVL